MGRDGGAQLRRRLSGTGGAEGLAPPTGNTPPTPGGLSHPLRERSREPTRAPGSRVLAGRSYWPVGAWKGASCRRLTAFLHVVVSDSARGWELSANSHRERSPGASRRASPIVAVTISPLRASPWASCPLRRKDCAARRPRAGEG